jgi:hypothetical protein
MQMTLSTEQEFILPYLNLMDPSARGWSIWSFTDLDWSIVSGLPKTTRMRTYHCEDVEDGQRLLAECFPLNVD